VDERAVRGAGDIPKLSSQVGREPQSPKTKHPVLGLASVRILTVRVGLALTGPRRQTRLIHLRGSGQVREVLRGLVGLDTSAHVKLLV